MSHAAQILAPSDYEPGTDTLRERTVLVTGAGAGIGRATALAAARAGATVVLLDRRIRPLESVYDEIERLGAPRPALYPMDLLGATPEDHGELAERLEESFGGLHGLVHNAADLGKPAPLAHYDPETWLRTLQVNLNAPFLLTRACLPLMQRTPGARMIFVSDAAGRVGRPFTGAYGVSKAGLEGLMRTLAAELPDDSPLTVTSIDPGPVHTMLRRKAYPAEESDRLPEPVAAAHAVLYLLDPNVGIPQGAVCEARYP